VPGLVLGLGFGVGPLVITYGLLHQPHGHLTRPVERVTGRHWSWAAAVLLGFGMIAWIRLELIYLPNRSWLGGALRRARDPPGHRPVAPFGPHASTDSARN
jgi:hypothetical protein